MMAHHRHGLLQRRAKRSHSFTIALFDSGQLSRTSTSDDLMYQAIGCATAGCKIEEHG